MSLGNSDVRPLNINVGILGHVDSGKTSLSKCLSKVKSTAAFDKHPQSQERGITIDLGFSSLKVNLPEHLRLSSNDFRELQFTFVDCPGHSSLLKTVIGGTQIIDIVLLVIDITKGIQTQTAECLIIAEVTCKKMIFVLNKVDLIPEAKRTSTIEKMKKRIRGKLLTKKTPFGRSPIIVTSALTSDSEHSPFGVTELIDALITFTVLPKHSPDKPFVFAVDHCFGIHGQGTILTGTIIQGSVHVNDTIEFPSLNLQKKIKSMQIFRCNTDYAEQGDRLGICVKQLDPKQIERTLVCSSNYLSYISAGIIDINKIKYFKSDIKTGTKFHITIGYENVIAKIILFCSNDNNDFDINKEYLYIEKFYEENCEIDMKIGKQFAVLEFDRPIITIPDSLVIGSKFDIDASNNVCRLAFFGNLIYSFSEKNYSHSQLSVLKVYKIKEKHGAVDRIINEYEVIGKNIFKKDSNIERFYGFKVNLSSGELGVIDKSFGKSGKIVIRIPNGLSDSTIVNMNKISKKKSKHVSNNESDNNNEIVESIKFSMTFKKYSFNKDKKIVQ
ncbi:eukaryotic translation elongation factor, selenocysteine-specific [Lycorma delicatula]|uniref:eukaryotic translation elongation factor, selenocysteine-specific n=1 Tax=Lycorma delicatula TaxID=130591 RepID=UPI003F51A343